MIVNKNEFYKIIEEQAETVNHEDQTLTITINLGTLALNTFGSDYEVWADGTIIAVDQGECFEITLETELNIFDEDGEEFEISEEQEESFELAFTNWVKTELEKGDK